MPDRTFEKSPVLRVRKVRGEPKPNDGFRSRSSGPQSEAITRCADRALSRAINTQSLRRGIRQKRLVPGAKARAQSTWGEASRNKNGMLDGG